MYDIKFDIDYKELSDFVEALKRRLKKPSHLQRAIETAGKYAVQEWIRTANSKFRHSEGEYVRGILEGVSYPHGGNPLEVVIDNKVPHALYLEEGFTSFDMKKMLTTSNKVRVNKKTGERYLVIPFRHGTPGSTTFRSTMPKEIYRDAKRLKPSVVVEKFREGIVQRGTKLENPIPSEKVLPYIENAEFMRENNPAKVVRRKYIWGERLTGVGGKYEGMVRFESNVNVVREDVVQNTALGKFTYSRLVNRSSNDTQYSQYMTFRVMSEHSTNWVHPGIRGRYILKETKERIEQPIYLMLGDALNEDLKEMGFS